MSAVLYGSVARGDDREGSDVDLIVVVKDRRGLDDRISRLLGDWMARTDLFFELHLVTPDEYEALRTSDLPFAFALREEGEVLA